MGSKGGNTTTSQFKPPAVFMDAYKQSLDMARQATSQPYQQYQGKLVAGLTPTQLKGIANVNAAQGMALPAIQKGMDYTQQAAKGITPELYQKFYSPYVKDVADTTFANLMESQAQQQSNLKSGAIQAGAFGGDRGGIAQAEMARQQQLGNAMSMSNIYNQGYGQAMGLAGQQVANLGAMGQQMAGLGAGAQASVLQGAQAQMAAGAQQQATQQAALQAAYEQWMQRQSYPYQQAQFFANIAQGLGAGAGGTSSTTSPSPNWLSQLMGGVGAIGSIFSDEKLKENIEPVGKLNDGQTIYRYNFKGDPKTQIGLIAQEVESRKPGAVTEAKGLKMVNYKDATDDAASMGGVVGRDGGRQFLAEGGIPYYPYADARSYVPEGKIGSRGSTIPDAPPAPEDKGLAEDWKTIMPLNEDQIGGLRKLASDVGIDLPERKTLGDIFRKPKIGPTDAEKAWITISSPAEYASGGVAGRGNYADGGDTPYIDAAIDEASGLGAASDLLMRESGGNFSAENPQGYIGRAQFGPARLAEAKSAGVVPPDMTPDDFKSNPDVQKATERWHFGDINDFIDKTGLASIEGKTIKGIPVTRQGLVNVAHLGGKHGLEKFVASGGRYDPADANGTRLSDYLAMAAKGGVGDATPVPAAADAPPEGLGGAEPTQDSPGLGGIMSKFDGKKIFANDENPSIIERIMGRRLSPEARSAVMNASFALMAGRSPFFFTNLGEAGKVGTQTYYNALQNQRELAKQQADIRLTEQERTIQEANAETARLNVARQLYAQMLPQIKFWQMRHPGEPLPPEYRRVIDAAYPPEGPAGIINAPGLAPQIAGPAAPAGGDVPAPVVPGSTSAPAPAPTDGSMPPATGVEDVGGTSTAPAPTQAPASGNTELDALYSQLPDELNPNYWTRMAENAMTTEDYNNASQRAAELTKQYQESGIPTRNGVVPFPGKLELQSLQKSNELRTTANFEATQKQTEKAYASIDNYQTNKNTLDQAAATLATTQTGQLADTKAYLVTALKSLGLPADASMIEQAEGTQKLNKAFSQILFGGGLKDKIGSQIAAQELEMFSRGFGDVNLEPSVNRFIIGTMRGILDFEKKRSDDWISFMEGRDKPLSTREIAAWQNDWAKNNKVSDFVNESIANTPVMGELNFSDPSSRAKAKTGYKYVLPNGKIATYNGTAFEVDE